MNTMRTFLLLVFIAISLTNCIGRYAVREEFEESLRKYNDLLQRNELTGASLFTTKALSEEFMVRVKAAKDVRVIDYRILRINYDEAGCEAEVQVEITYYNLSSLKVKTLYDTQKWVLLKENGKKHWRLVSLLPEFR